jgi:hypothetical protein
MDTGVNVPRRPEVASREALKDWLEYVSAGLDARWKEIHSTLRLLVGTPIEDEETAGVFTENLRMAAALRSAVEELHRQEKEPYWNNGKLVDAWLKTFTVPLDELTDKLRATLRAYAVERDRARVFEDKEPVRGQFGATASVRETWGYEIEDITKVPAEYLTVDAKMVRAVLADRDPKTKVPRRKIPGIRWVRSQQLAVS